MERIVANTFGRIDIAFREDYSGQNKEFFPNNAVEYFAYQ